MSPVPRSERANAFAGIQPRTGWPEGHGSAADYTAGFTTGGRRAARKIDSVAVPSRGALLHTSRQVTIELPGMPIINESIVRR